jgi:hypothetical protein
MTAPAYLVASRQGLYAVGRDRWRLLVEGCFFGLVRAADSVFAFRHGPDSPGCDPRCGDREVRGQTLKRGAGTDT